MRWEHWKYTLPLRVRSLFRGSRVEAELDDELRYHLEHRIEQGIAQSLTPADARREALRAMDGLTQHKEECRDMRRINFIENTMRDIRYSVRVLAKSPGFTLVAVATLALAIGANAVVFGILNALVLRPLNVAQSETLYEVQRGQNGYQSYPDYADERDRNRTFESIASYNIDGTALDANGNSTPAWTFSTSGNYFDVLRVQPFLGRFYHGGFEQGSPEHGPASAPYIVLSYPFWHNQFADDREIVGRVVRLNKHPFTIIGIAPPDFRGTLMVFTPDIFIPIVNHDTLFGGDLLTSRSRHWIFSSFGHLKPGVTPAQAAADLNSIGSWLQRTYANDEPNWAFSLGRPGLYGDFLGRPVRAFVTGLTMLAALILLAACANLGSLFAARASDRGREVALRLALGAARNRILRQLLTEAVIISMIGGAAGLLGSVVILRYLSVWQPFSRFPITVPVAPDGAVYTIALVLALASGILFGLVPVRQVLRTDPYQIVKAGTAAGNIGRRVSFRDVLLVVQIALCAVLVTSSMVALRGLVRSMHSNLGFEPQNAMLVHTDLPMAGYTSNHVPAVQKRMIEAMEAIPGVDAAALINQPPLAMSGTTTTVFKDESTDLRPAAAIANPYVYEVSPGYLAAAGTRLLAGRGMTWHDDAGSAPVAIVNREFARRLFGSVENAIGRYFKRKEGTRFQVIGIVEDGKYLNLTEEQRPAMFLSFLQAPDSESWLVLRSSRDSQQVAAAVRAALRDLDPGLPCFVQTWTQGLNGVLFPSRMATISLGVLGAMGAMLSITGIFGMAAYSVSKRMRELGIRMALGAQPRELLEAALGRALKMLAIGSVAGLLLGLFATRVLAVIVYHATPRDPLVLCAVVLAMLALGLLATWIPAQRALSIDPLRLLREE